MCVRAPESNPAHLQTYVPPHSRHWCRCRPWTQMHDPPHSLQRRCSRPWTHLPPLLVFFPVFPVTLFTSCAPWTRFWWYHSPDLPAHCLPHGSQTYLGFSPLFAGVVFFEARFGLVAFAAGAIVVCVCVGGAAAAAAAEEFWRVWCPEEATGVTSSAAERRRAKSMGYMNVRTAEAKSMPRKDPLG